MLRKLFQSFPYVQDGFTNGLINGSVLVFLILIGLPAGMPGREDLAPLAIPLFVLITITFAVVTVRRFEGKTNWRHLLANGIALGIGTAIPFLLFMSLINRWQANGTDVNSYFFEVKLRTTEELSGVPEAELFSNPDIDPVTGDFLPDEPLRTNPMALKINDDRIQVFDFGVISFGGVYGTALVLALYGILAILLYRAWELMQWQKIRHQIDTSLNASTSGRQFVTVLHEIFHWVKLLLPIYFFLLLFTSVPMNYDTSFWNNVLSENGIEEIGRQGGTLYDLNENFGFGARAVQNFQLMSGFLIVIVLMLAMRSTRYKTYRLPYLLQLLVILVPIWLVFLLSMWRIQANQVTFIKPTYDVLGDPETASIFAMFLLTCLLTLNAVRSSLTAEQFESTFVINTGLAMVMAMPLFMDQYQTGVMLQVAIYAMLGLGLNIVVGYAGLLDLGYVAFFAMGAYVYAMVESNRQRLSLDHANELAFVVGTSLIIVPLVIFIAANLWLRSRGTASKEVSTKQTQHMAYLWKNQPPLLVSALLVVIAVVVAFGTTEILKAAGLFDGVNRVSPFFIGLTLAVIASGFTGFLLGFPVLRLRSDYLAIVTLGFGEIISISLENLENITGGPFGATNIHDPVAGRVTTAEQNMILLYLALVGAGLIAVLSSRLRASRLGRTWTAIRSDEDIAQAQGINLVNSKLLAFAIGASFAGMAGLLFASRQNNIFPADFSLNISINVLALVIIGGVGSIPGVIVGTIVLVGLPQMLRALEEYRYLTFGALLVIMMLVRPAGLMPAPLASLEERARKLRATIKSKNEEVAGD